MAPNSIDDKYDGCTSYMYNEINTVYLPHEKKTNSDFMESWKVAEAKWNLNNGLGLKKEQFMAIYAYTNEAPAIYQDFNKKVRKDKDKYGKSFQYHSLHFYLTEAIHTLNEPLCLDTYRRTTLYYDRNVVNKKFRFGTFTSSSLRTNLLNFGNVSCFKIRTCYGANVARYSAIKRESEILIPPYEVFNVTNVQTKPPKGPLDDCEVVYTVVSTRTPKSDLNCKLVRNGGTTNLRSSFVSFIRASDTGYIMFYIMLITTVYY
ncbi:NAD(P)(+)--arginine ADP-ribosyltransferase 2-like [Salvelinus alpinus]|uniref:NAD(P)(+)--arginine ADP-ribosyltransferase 2-like n=1 Tax=Salvelinus alpinus TaxID=8036 RepID=UPI0039FBADFB